MKYITILSIGTLLPLISLAQTGDISDIPSLDVHVFAPLIQHEMVPLELKPILPELCEDGQEKQAPGTTCDDNDSYTQDDKVQEDGCSCEGEVPPINITYGNPSIRYTQDGLPFIADVQSVNVVGGGAPFCSMIARLNLKQFFPEKEYVTGIGSTDVISLGDAVTLIQDGIQKELLTQIQTMDMQRILDASEMSVIDMYLYTPNGYSIDDVKRYLQGHRAVFFEADDGEWYVLDPLRGSASTQPQPIRDYVYHYTNKNAHRYMHTQLVYPEKKFELDESGFLIDIPCEISLHQSMLLHQESTLLYSGQVCFDVADMCSL